MSLYALDSDINWDSDRLHFESLNKVNMFVFCFFSGIKTLTSGRSELENVLLSVFIYLKRLSQCECMHEKKETSWAFRLFFNTCAEKYYFDYLNASSHTLINNSNDSDSSKWLTSVLLCTLRFARENGRHLKYIFFMHVTSREQNSLQFPK